MATNTPDVNAAWQALITQHDLVIHEWDMAGVDDNLRASYMAHMFVTNDDRNIIVVPVGQDPRERLVAVAKLVEHLEKAA
ncbi:hypothetical protein [Streptomyces sp. NPDC018833]|uniref:hypothetical protein n=1 Tax=Streptomyces sp. NPDC018833 TaxID=3365053 RepID=UPI0037AC12C5